MMDGCWFFGAGKKGRAWLKRFRDFGVVPEGFLDNRRELHETFCVDILICSPEKLDLSQLRFIFITCKEEADIKKQLLELGIPEHKIVYHDHNILNHLLYEAAKRVIPASSERNHYESRTKETIFLDLQNGMVLGGVESWSYELARRLTDIGYQGQYLTTDVTEPTVEDDAFPSCILLYQKMEKDVDKIKACVQKISEHLPCTIICNFPQLIFWSACIARQLYPKQVRVIAVQHNDSRIYYETYSLWQEFIDKCVVISSRMEEKLLSFGMRAEKLVTMNWQIECEEYLERSWSKEGECFQIGYAGRITTAQKRVDLFLVLAEKLKERGLSFQFHIAGSGEYSEALKRSIEEKQLQGYLIMEGHIDRKNIPDFWSRQDIMVSCSEWEGHSISQAEAMARGAVPVVTDVSGAYDDIQDGYNGFVIEVGDLDGMVERICDLYHNRKQLEEMGTCAHDRIYRQHIQMDQTRDWENWLENIWL